LFLAGHAAFKAAIWRRISWPRLTAIAALALFALLAPHVPALALAACGTAAVLAVAVADHIWLPEPAMGDADAVSRRHAGLLLRAASRPHSHSSQKCIQYL
jgi:hypothetical protein